MVNFCQIKLCKRKKILIAGATGNLGQRIAKALIEQGAAVDALVRRVGAIEKISNLKKMGVRIHELDFDKQNEMVNACSGASCVVSGLSGPARGVGSKRSRTQDRSG